MRPNKFGIKPHNKNPARLRRTTRATGLVASFAGKLVGGAEDKAIQTAITTLIRIPRNNPELEGKAREDLLERKRLFRINANDALKKRRPIGPLHCAERCNLAIALLNKAGVNAWLLRAIKKGPVKENGQRTWEYHDVVEFADGRQIKTLAFESDPRLPLQFQFNIIPGRMEEILANPDYVFLRGADSKQIGGVGNWNEYKKFSSKLNDPKNLAKEIEKNKRRISLLIKDGIIPQSVAFQIRN